MATERAHVLVVDDAPELRALFRDLLESEGYRVTVQAAAPPIDAVAALAPDALLLDLLLGEDEGAAWELVEAMRVDPRLCAVPVVVCSAATDLLRRLRPRFADLGVAALAKPFELDDFSAVIADAVGRPRPR